MVRGLAGAMYMMAAIMGFAGLATAVTYEVGPGRTYVNLQAVAALLQPGDLVLVDGNAVYPGDVVFSEPGLPDNPITVRGVRISGNRPVISGGTNTVTFESPWPYTSGADHYIFEGFIITGGSFRGLYHQSDDLTVRDVLVYNCPAHGILGADNGSGSVLLEAVEVYGCGSGDSRHQIYMATDEENHPGSVFCMRYCYIHDGVGGNNVKTRAERNEIYYNWIEGAYYHELELIGPDGADPELKREDSDVVGNVFWKRNNTSSVTRCGGDGTGETDGRYRFVNNTIIANSNAVFRLFDGIESIEMHNNVIYRPGGGVNMMRTIDARWSTGAELIAGSNNWVMSGAANVPAQWIDTITGSDPGFTNFSGNDVRPAAGSPLVNSGASSTAGPPGYPLPDPLFPPGMQPPLHTVTTDWNSLIRPANGALDIGAYERAALWCVDDSNTTGSENGSALRPFNTIMEAVNAAAAGDSIRVAGGTYSQNVTIENKRLTLEGGYAGGAPANYSSGQGGDFTSRDVAAHPSLISAGSSGPAVWLKLTGASGTAIDGFTIRGGRRGIDFDNTVTWPLLDGITVTGSIIENNGSTAPSHRGGGLFVTGSNHVISGNIIRNNNSGRGAGIACAADDLVIAGNIIEDNTSYEDHGGGIYQSGTASITGNTVRGNSTGLSMGYGWGGGVLILGTATMSDNNIYGNIAPSIGGGVFVDEGGQAVLVHELIHHNTTTASDKGGAGIYVDGGAGPSRATIRNCTVANNTSPGSTGGNGVYIEGESSATVENCVFWGNGGDDFYVDGSSSIAVSYSLSEESIAGTGNIRSDPRFADPVTHDYHLKSAAGRWDPDAGGGSGAWINDTVSSPAIDAGNPAASYADEPLPNGGRLNMGWYGNTAEASKSGLAPVVVPAMETVGIALLVAALTLFMRQAGRNRW